ncbi:MAG: hypothetical protein NZV14_03185 [Bryobacteraceae bacterium]|nr:hypothetical protein [Bryobacteraceae bacterium]MDW8377139.1 hypothetical protein [Bryobacterales bacterium]
MSAPHFVTGARATWFLALDPCQKVADRFKHELARAGFAIAFEWHTSEQLRQLSGVALRTSLALGVFSPLDALRWAVQEPAAILNSIVPVILIEIQGKTQICYERTPAQPDSQIRKLEGAIYATGGRPVASHFLKFNGGGPTGFGCRPMD